jgi:hypothetical protein
MGPFRLAVDDLHFLEKLCATKTPLYSLFLFSLWSSITYMTPFHSNTNAWILHREGLGLRSAWKWSDLPRQHLTSYSIGISKLSPHC